MILLNPKKYSREVSDDRSREVMQKTIAFFEGRGLAKLKEDFHERTWYADFIQFMAQEKILATMMTNAENGGGDARWDTSRVCEFAEILGFYGLCYWYVYQVSVLGIGPIWMSHNPVMKNLAARYLEEGEIFAFGLSEKEHGADIYSSDMVITPQEEGRYTANGGKYYIGNANQARMVSTFGRMADSGEYVFFVADSQQENYHLVKNVVNSQSYVAEFELKDYEITDEQILARGDDAWNAALNTVNVGKFNLGWASIGMCTHAFYEAIDHAAARRLYSMYVTDFPHVKRLFTEAWARLIAMKLFALRASDYFRSASADDRRYLLYNPIVKMKVTTQGEEVIDLLWDVIAAKGFEKDTSFEMMAIDIRALPKLEGTVHVNMALVIKFMANYFFGPEEYPEVPQRFDAADDAFLFNQGPARGLGKIHFHDYKAAYDSYDFPNLAVFKEQIALFREALVKAPATAEQGKDIDFLLTVGELFTLVVYGQLILENARIYDVPVDVLDQVFDFMVRDFSRYALEFHNKPSSTEAQMGYARRMIRKPVIDEVRYQKVWTEQVYALKGEYEMNA
ncbi:MAG: acyl-CoA dehydrogenase family protein [Xanthomonadales bacterium]|jgi:acyl-CoA dehydrogenase|nr:acyl-CoA dehydrogenase family protein [Xanthomonadales bacterium]